MHEPRSDEYGIASQPFRFDGLHHRSPICARQYNGEHHHSGIGLYTPAAFTTVALNGAAKIVLAL